MQDRQALPHPCPLGKPRHKQATRFWQQRQSHPMTVLFHADDYGITAEQARAILALSSACGGYGVLNSASAFANSPAFEEAAELAAPHVSRGALHMGIHINLVEGRPCADPADVALLTGPRETFCHDFVGLLRLARGAQRDEARRQIELECRAQIERFLTMFPLLQGSLRVDSHQHTHAIPLVLDAVLGAAHTCGCTLEHLRTPVEPLLPHVALPFARCAVTPANLAKDGILTLLWRSNVGKLPQSCATSLFCGVVLSGRMDHVDARLVDAFEAYAHKQEHRRSSPRTRLLDGNVELLFHPVSVPITHCLDPENEPFATACAASGRTAEARRLAQLESERAS